MSTTFKTNEKLIGSIENVTKRFHVSGNVEILNRTDERAYEISEYVKHGKSGCNYREEGDINFRFIYDGYLCAVIIDEDLKTLDYNIIKKLEKECAKLESFLDEVYEQQYQDYWESQDC